MNSSLGYASYQQQSSDHADDTVSIILFFTILVLLFLFFILYFWYTEWYKIPIEQRGDQAVSQQQEVYLLVDNMSMQVKTAFKIPLITLATVLYQKNQSSTDAIPHAYERVYADRLYHLLSLFFLFTFFISLAILIGATNEPNPQTTLFLVVLSINLYLISRQRCYYRQRRKLFDQDAHFNAVYDTRFSNWDKSMGSNWVQMTILVIEFFQLMTFPLRDLLSSLNRPPNSSQTVSFIMNAGGLMPDMRTPSWYTYSLWTTFVVTLCGLCLGCVIHCVNLRYPYKISTRWVRWCIPVVTLLYIPILTTFVSSAACQSFNLSTNDFSLTLRCNASHIHRQLYFWLSLLGYILAYFLATIFLTSHEKAPIDNEIAYKSISVAFIKNMGLLLAIVFLLVESTTRVNRMRAILSITILLTMICYNIKTSPCYVDKDRILYLYSLDICPGGCVE
ncbi:hypothetical protein CU098_005446 [Rhizopus stolonifer]|uniref:Uncharacterized protein n=1 Tax=Rhizopus stolonifer TaxID=4846 RepID=A0A367KVR5_RHIST|nr:hypothetical protein CU098_005446 [Rhizopus stolonifer]